MHAKSTVAAALLAASPLVSAGSSVIQNQCNFPVYLNMVSDYAGSQDTIQSGSTWSKPYQTATNGGGISLKLSTSQDSYTSAITQLEYTVGSTLFYDMSNINGNPFMQWGMSLKPSSSSCRNVLCKAGVEDCSEAYNTPDQNEATAACTPDSDLVLTLCPGVLNSAGQAIGGALDVAETHERKHHHKGHKHHNDSDKKNHNKHHNKHHKEPAPVPAPTSISLPASIPVPASISVPAAALTTFLTQVVTVTARDAKPSAEANAHANYHRHHFHRHS